MQGMSTNSINGSSFQELHSDDFFEQMLSSIPSWPDLDGSNGYAPFDESAVLASRLRHHQIDGGEAGGRVGAGSFSPEPTAGFQLSTQQQQQQQMLLSSMARSPASASAAAAAGGGVPLALASNGDEFESAFKSPNSSSGGDQGMYNSLGGSLQQHFHHSQIGSAGLQQNLGGGGGSGAAPGLGIGAAGSEGGGTAPSAAAPRQRVRARRGQATDPHSIAERLRRERIAERMKALQELVPNANKTDKASMLDEIIDYVKFLQLQVKVLSMSRLGGAAVVAPLVGDVSSEQTGRSGSSTCGGVPSPNDNLTVTEQQVAKLMEEDMGSAMQYLQGKGLCLMPISLASAISTATCRTAPSAPVGGLMNAAAFLANGGGADGPSSPSPSVLTVQSAVAGSAKEAASVSKRSTDIQ